MQVSVAGLLFGCQKGTRRDAAGEASAPQEKRGEKSRGGRKGEVRDAVTSVRVVEVEAKVLPRTVSVISVLSGRKQADVHPKVAGRISYLGANEGAAVKAGEVLFRVDRSDPGESFLAAPVVSPISGWVGRWMVRTIGEQVSPQDPVVTVVDDAALRATVYLPANDWLHVSKDTPVRVILADAERRGKVITIARSADAASSRGSVVVEVDNMDHGWRAGLVARFAFDLDPQMRTLIPAQALTITDRGAYLFVAQEDIAKRRAVEFRVVSNDVVEVTKGLDAKSVVIVAGAANLSDGSQIKILNDQDQVPKAH